MIRVLSATILATLICLPWTGKSAAEEVVDYSSFARKVVRNQNPCKALGDDAELIMKLRQNNTPMNKLMTIAENSESYKTMVIAAYGLPLFVSEDFKTKAISEFRNSVEFGCYTAK